MLCVFRAGGEGQPCVFLFSDTQIKTESFVEDINNLLNAGEIPNLFPYDERAAVLEQCRILAKKEGLALESPAELWNYFIDKTKANLHIVLCFSPIGSAFRHAPPNTSVRMLKNRPEYCSYIVASIWG